MWLIKGKEFCDMQSQGQQQHHLTGKEYTFDRAYLFAWARFLVFYATKCSHK